MSEIDVPSGRLATMPTPRPGDPALRRLSLNQMTTRSWSVREAIDGCVRAGIPAVGLWRAPVAEAGVQQTARMVADSGLRVSSLCRGGFLTTADPGARREALEDNRRAVDEAAALGTDVLVLVAGGLPHGSRDLPGARERVEEALVELAPYAGERGVQLALEPLHPMYCADRAVISTLGQALGMAQPFPANEVGVVVDTFHIWWDPQVLTQIAASAGRIASFQVCDWITPLPENVLLARGMMGDGHIDFAPLVSAVSDAGYRGDIEVEIFNQDVWDTDPDQVVATVARRYVGLGLGGE